MSIEMEMGWGWDDPILATKMVDCPLCGGDAVVLTNNTMDCWGTETVPPCTDRPMTIQKEGIYLQEPSSLSE
tara:strand:+ start:614 stop:829 length:216 start_codon:yes stop_codon:yes gene_type:complete